ncbi:MAG TPA: molybdopterin-dependent oxidoreductase [Acidimicrobiia bacterium]
MAEVLSYCRICAASCGIVVRSEGDHVISVRGDADHPVSLGYTCAKGRALPALHHHPQRLDEPEVRGVAQSWDDTLDDLARELETAIAAHGPDAIGAYLGTGLAYDTAGFVAATAWLAAIGSSRLYTPATIDNAPVLRAAELIAGHPQANPICDFERAQCVVIVGSNPVVSHGYGTAIPDPIKNLRRVRERGGAVWVLDPVRTETAAVADHYLAVRPGSDAAVLAWLVRERLAEPVSEAALACTSSIDRDALTSALAPFTLERAARAAGVDARDLGSLRDAVLTADGALAAWCGTGVTTSRDGFVAEALRWVLLALSGSLDTTNGMRFHRGLVFPLRRPRAGSGRARQATLAPTPVSRPELRHWLGQDPCVSFADEVASDGVRALVVAGANPITAFPQPDATRAALARLDTLAVVDVSRSELTATATHVLPAAAQLERADIPMHELVSVRGGSWHSPAAIPRSAGRRPAWWIFAELSRRMTGNRLFGVESTALDDDGVFALLAARSSIPFDTIRAAGPHGVTVEPEAGWARAELLDGGPWNIAPDALLARLAHLGVDDTPDDAANDLVLVPRRRARANNSVDDPIERRREPLLLLNPSDAADAGVVDGDEVRVTSAHGSISTKARVDARVRRGVVSMSHGDAGASAGALVSAHEHVDPETGMPRASGVPVAVEPIVRRPGV